MPLTYPKGRIRFVCEDDLAVAFARDTTRDDGSTADKQWLDLVDGGWLNDFDPARHVRRLDRDPAPGREARQSFSPPNDYLVEPQATAEVYVVDSAGAIVTDFAAVESNQAYSLVRRFSAGP